MSVLEPVILICVVRRCKIDILERVPVTSNSVVEEVVTLGATVDLLAMSSRRTTKTEVRAEDGRMMPSDQVDSFHELKLLNEVHPYSPLHQRGQAEEFAPACCVETYCSKLAPVSWYFGGSVLYAFDSIDVFGQVRTPSLHCVLQMRSNVRGVKSFL